jgi:phosphoribosylglycinamide formyltransferase-1
MNTPLRLAAMISGGGRTLMNLADRIDDGSIPATIELVISSRADAPGVQRAAARGLPLRIARGSDFESEDQLHATITTWLAEAAVDLVCLCGYLRWMRIEPRFVGRVINIHPALLPRFGGKGMFGPRVHKAVLAAGCSTSGCTVHFVDEQYDHGPTILQRVCPVLPGDDVHSLAERVFTEECLAYPEAIRLIACGQVRLTGGHVEILPRST